MFTFFILRLLRRRSNLTYEQRRYRFFCMAGVYLSLFLIAGFVLLGLYLGNNQDQSLLYPMIFCFAYGGLELILILGCLLAGNLFGRRQNDTVIIENSRQYPMALNYNDPYSPNFNYQNPQNLQSAEQRTVRIPDTGYIQQRELSPNALNNAGRQPRRSPFASPDAQVVVNANPI